MKTVPSTLIAALNNIALFSFTPATGKESPSRRRVLPETAGNDTDPHWALAQDENGEASLMLATTASDCPVVGFTFPRAADAGMASLNEAFTYSALWRLMEEIDSEVALDFVERYIQLPDDLEAVKDAEDLTMASLADLILASHGATHLKGEASS